MYFEKVDISEIPANHRDSKIGEEILTLIKEFEKTDFEAAEVKDWTHKNAKSFIAIARTVLKRYKNNNREICRKRKQIVYRKKLRK